MLVFCTDITRIKEIELQNKGQKMRDTFFSSVAHELRTPLNSIIPIVRLILLVLTTGVISVDMIERNLKVVLNSALHLESLVEDALDLSRIENNKFTLNKEYFDLRLAINSVCDIMKFQTDSKKLSLELNILNNVPASVFSDAKRLKQVLFNLIGNAIKFTFSGKIVVRACYNDKSSDLEFEVEDTGVGIEQEDLVKLFKFFGKLSKSKEINKGGMGLGLTISKMIIN